MLPWAPFARADDLYRPGVPSAFRMDHVPAGGRAATKPSLATRPGLRQRVFAVYPRPRICVIHLTNTTLAPPSRKSQLRPIIVRCPANAGGAYWLPEGPIQD